MAAKRIKRQAATPRGVERRVHDARFDTVGDPRQQAKVRFSLAGLLGLFTYAVASGASSLRAIETRSEQLRAIVREPLGLPDERVADNSLGAVLRAVSPSDLRRCLHQQVKAEARRGNLEPTLLACGLSVAAADGKALSTLRWRDLQQAARTVLAQTNDTRAEDPDWMPDVDDVRAVFGSRFPEVQLVQPEGQSMHGVLRMHRVTLVSSDAAVCIDQRPIEGATNEVGAMPSLLRDLFAAYGRTGLVDVITADAGNTSLAVARQIVEHGSDYFLSIKSPNGAPHEEALRVLGAADDRTVVMNHSEERSGQTVAYRVWTHALPQGHLGWTHARQLVRVERVTVDAAGECKTGNRYFVTSLDAGILTPADVLTLVRLHWRCENEGHWTSDAILGEDARRQTLARHPHAMVNASWLRMIAQNIVAVLRALSRMGRRLEKPRWASVLEHIAAVLFDTRLDAHRFDAEQAACAV